MKKQFITGVLGLTMLTTMVTTAMAADVPANKKNYQQESGIYIVKEKNDTMYYGTLTKDEFISLIEKMDYSDTEKDNLLKQFDNNIGMKFEMDDYYTNETETLHINNNNFITDEMISKAIELGYLQKETDTNKKINNSSKKIILTKENIKDVSENDETSGLVAFDTINNTTLDTSSKNNEEFTVNAKKLSSEEIAELLKELNISNSENETIGIIPEKSTESSSDTKESSSDTLELSAENIDEVLKELNTTNSENITIGTIPEKNNESSSNTFELSTENIDDLLKDADLTDSEKETIKSNIAKNETILDRITLLYQNKDNLSKEEIKNRVAELEKNLVAVFTNEQINKLFKLNISE